MEQRSKTPQVSQDKHGKSIRFWEYSIKEDFLASQGELHDILLKASHDPALSFSQPEVMVLAHNLRKAKITKRSDVENKFIEKIKKTLWPYLLNAKEIQFLCRLFNLRPIDKLKFDLLGLGYSRKQEETRSRILDVPTKELAYDKGIFVPRHFTTEQYGAVSIDIKYRDAGNIKIEFTIRFILFKVEMEETSKLSLNAGLTKFLEEYNSRNCSESDLIPLEEFDKKYGSNCISGLQFGGSLNGSIADEYLHFADNKDILIQQIRCHLDNYFDYLMSHNQPDSSPYEMEDAILDDLKKCQLTWRGGDKQFYSKTLGGLTPKSWNEWTDSLHDNLILLDVHVNTTLFDILNASPDVAMRNYAKYFESITSSQPDLSDSYYYTAPDFPSKSGQSNLESSESIYTREFASVVYKSQTLPCNLL